MDVRNCKMCGRLFNVLNNERICPACQKKLEDKFHEVKEYLERIPEFGHNDALFAIIP